MKRLHLVTSPDGTRQYQLDHFSIQGASGTTTSGDTVILTQAATASIRRVSYGQYELDSYIVEIHETLATQGKTKLGNTIAQLQFSVTYNANGQPVVSLNNFDVKCLG